jgi:signal transduction histidine kinase/DNA-binding response OmpR family regulator
VENNPVVPVGTKVNHPVPDRELERLEYLRKLRILDSNPEQQYDDIALLASSVCDTPVAHITLIDEKRVWFKSRIGLRMTETPRETFFCNHAILQTEVFLVPDAVKDERFQNNPLVVSGPKLQFYAGVPLVLTNGLSIGTLCVLDTRQRALTLRQQEILKLLGRQAVAHVEYRRTLSDVTDELDINRDLADSATKVKSSFLANMSHEIRTPMTAILGMTDLLLGGELRQEQREYLATIRSSGESLLTILNDILDFSKIESGKMELERETVDLRVCIEDALETVAEKAHARRNELLYAIDPNVPRQIVGDGVRLRQILVNLTNNAIKFTQSGEIVLSVRLNKRMNGNLELMFSVKDTGIGISKDKLESIFEAFTQADSSVTRKYGGAGLGLVICSRLVNLMGGRIGVESAEGKGSRFHFTIRTMSPPSGESVKNVDTAIGLEGKRILIVDDSATNLQILSEECKQLGMIPYTSDSPIGALESIKRGDLLDIAIYDMQMPEKDGVQLALETLEARGSLPLPIILLSSWDLSDPRIKQNHGLFAATVMKPLKISQFQSLLKSVLSKKRTESVGEQRAAGKKQGLVDEVPISILVAEDNLINQKLIQRMLRSMGYEPTIVGTGLEVLKTLEHTRCDLIFMDVQMPELDGMEATQRIRQRYGPEALPKIVAMTAFALAGDKEKCLKAGMDDYLSKPFNADQIAAMIRKWGGNKSTAASEIQKVGNVRMTAVDYDIETRLNELEQETERSFVKELIGIFFEEAPANLQTLKDAYSAKDRTAIEQLAHKLKGGSLNLGAKKLGSLFESLETQARKDPAAISVSLVAEISREFDRTADLLRRYVTKL